MQVAKWGNSLAVRLPADLVREPVSYTHLDVYKRQTLNCTMRFAIYLPPQAAHGPVPVLYWLSGLTCAEQNFITKAGAQRYAAEHGIAIVAPDTSPRGDNVADAEGYDIGKGAGFYVNATQAPWAAHYRMYDYVVDELPALVEAKFPVTDARAIKMCIRDSDSSVHRRMRRMPVLQIRQDQPVHLGTRDAGQGRDAGWHLAFQLQRPAAVPLHGLSLIHI